MEDTRTVQDIFNDINEAYATFLNQLDRFLDEVNNDFTPDR